MPQLGWETTIQFVVALSDSHTTNHFISNKAEQIEFTVYRHCPHGFSYFFENFHISYCNAVYIQCPGAHPAPGPQALELEGVGYTIVRLSIDIWLIQPMKSE